MKFMCGYNEPRHAALAGALALACALTALPLHADAPALDREYAAYGRFFDGLLSRQLSAGIARSALSGSNAPGATLAVVKDGELVLARGYGCGSDRFILLDDYVTPELTVPAGEYTDGASRPAIAEPLGVKRYDRSLPACIVHDYMYREGIASKKEADDLFALNLRRCRDQFSFPGLLIQPMVIAVRIGGRGSYTR